MANVKDDRTVLRMDIGFRIAGLLTSCLRIQGHWDYQKYWKQLTWGFGWFELVPARIGKQQPGTQVF